MKENAAPFLMQIHCFTHQTNLVVLILSKLGLVALLQALYGFFFHSHKKFLEFQSLCDVLTKKGNKLMKNMATR